MSNNIIIIITHSQVLPVSMHSCSPVTSVFSCDLSPNTPESASSHSLLFWSLVYRYLLLPNWSCAECLGCVCESSPPLLSALVIISSHRLFRTSSPPRDPHSLFNFPVYKYLSLCTGNPSERWLFSVPSNQYTRLLRDSIRHPLFDFLPLPAPLDLFAHLAFFNDLWFVEVDYDSCLLPGTFAHQIFGFDSCLFFDYPFAFWTCTTYLWLPGYRHLLD